MTGLMTNLENNQVRLEVLDASHKEGLRRPAVEEALWQWMPYTGAGSSFDRYFDDIAETKSEAGIVPFAVIDRSNSRVVGVTAYLSISKHHRRLEIGHTWLGREARGTKIYASMSHLLLGHGFKWGARRIEINASASNDVALGAVRKLGATEEGRLRSQMRTVDGTWKDTVVFSVLKEEWPKISEQLCKQLDQ